MSNWLAQFYLGMFGAWISVKIYEQLCRWWKEGKQDLKIEVLHPNDRTLEEYRP